uniref:Cyclin-dependent kinase inhibitor 1B n=1 Tax=Monopterus albus TaxID=43700 RepID=A0A3Q3QJ11_MONAL|nr:cyclin-dependent kinase inhibitor 1B-like [Monopterus albus]XP_020457080.1 cyclin-dependent kinase inhibitor 1B-like [Monopterus albus]
MCNKMSDVRLSNASPTLERERVDARQPENVRPPVRRNLFGRPDPEALGEYLAASIQRDVQTFMETYNYDPVNDRPMTPRNYEWQEDSNPPEYFVRPPHGSQRPQRDVDLPGVNNCKDAEERTERRSGRPDGDSSTKRRSGDSGPCFSECQSKRLHFDDDGDDDDEDQSSGAGSQAVKAVEERPSAEIQ